MSAKGFAQRLGQKLKKIFLILFVAQLAYIIALKWIDPPITVTQIVSFIQGYGLKRDYVNRKDISPNAALAIIAAEDQLFPDHNGFDLKSIEKALKHNTKKPNRTRGASTISQQVAKNVFLWQDRNWIRKGIEAYLTFMIEWIWGKERILEMYLNVSEMGKGVFGIEAAAQKYFKKPAKNLTMTEAAMIASCLPNPKKFTVKPASSYVTRRYPKIKIQMNNIAGDPEIKQLTTGTFGLRKKKS